jgi:hypothetical protein
MKTILAERHFNCKVERVQASTRHAQRALRGHGRRAALAAVLLAHVLLEHEAALHDIDLFTVLRSEV